MALDVEALQKTLTLHPHELLEPSSTLHSSLLGLVKQYFDPLANSITQSQSQRQQEAREDRKRKRTADDHDRPSEELLRMKQVHVDGFGVRQVWQQARRVLDAAENEVATIKPNFDVANDDLTQGGENDDVDGLDEDSLGQEGVDWEVEGEDDDPNAVLESDIEEDESLEEGSPDIGAETPLSDFSDEQQEQAEDLINDKHGLNDGFFSIDRFNRQSEFLEHQDAKGDPNDGAARDEEEVDWTADPLTSGGSAVMNRVKPPSRKKASLRDEEDNDDEDDDGENDDDDDDDDGGGPTFGNVDLNASDTDDEDQVEADDEEDMLDIGGDFGNTNYILYADFFAPPAKQKGRSERRQRPKPSLDNRDDAGTEDDNAEVNRAMADVHRDIFDDDEDDVALSSDSASETAAGKAQNLSTHEKRLVAFRKEISKLERENVSKKHWALTGETLAPARPENALLEEDLDFERAGKPVPVITNEVNESIEELIKRRIIANEFDELHRRRPDIDGSSRRGLVDRRKEELSDAKPARGLADEYADEYLRKNDPNYVDSRSQATKAAHAAIASQWAELSAQLDSLSNYHYKPIPPEKSLDIRTDAAVVQMEEARPAAGAEASTSGLAPQEVYKPGTEGRKAGEVITKGGTTVAKEEETRESKRRRRNRDKARLKKASGAKDVPSRPADAAAATESKQGPKRSSKKVNRDSVVSALKKGDVKVIGKKGELRDVEGKAASTNAHGGRTGPAGFML